MLTFSNRDMALIDRRSFLLAAITAPAVAARKSFDYGRIAVLTDEVAKSPADAIAFARQYNLNWVELRSVPGGKGSYSSLDEPELRETAGALKAAGLRVSFLNTGLLKFQLPGTERLNPRQESPAQATARLAAEQARFDRRIDDLKLAIRSAHIFEVDKIRVFAFSRTPHPTATYPRVASLIGEMAEVAKKEGVHLLLENEESCNVATTQEAVELLKLLPTSVGLNWDPGNTLEFGEKPFPESYRLLPKDRLMNVQIKARNILPQYNQPIDWAGIFDALAADGYTGKVGLETHIFDGSLIEAAHKCLVEIRRILNVT
jgi:L-ribulose-5-phosphate 3-epimerase